MRRLLARLLPLSSNHQPIALQNAERYRRKGVRIGAGTYIYPNVVLGRDGQDPITIDRNCVLTGCTILAHDASTNRALGMERSVAMPVVIEDECFLGHGAIILMGVTVGRGSIVGAGSVVTSDVPAGSVVAGNPARVLGSVNELVHRRRQLALEHPEYFRDLPQGLEALRKEGVPRPPHGHIPLVF